MHFVPVLRSWFFEHIFHKTAKLKWKCKHPYAPLEVGKDHITGHLIAVEVDHGADGVTT